MNKIELDICIGTTCFVMGANKFQEINEYFPAEWNDLVEVKANTCLGLCQNNEYSKAPYVKIDGEIMPNASVEKILVEIKRKLNNN